MDEASRLQLEASLAYFRQQRAVGTLYDLAEMAFCELLAELATRPELLAALCDRPGRHDCRVFYVAQGSLFKLVE